MVYKSIETDDYTRMTVVMAKEILVAVFMAAVVLRQKIHLHKV